MAPKRMMPDDPRTPPSVPARHDAFDPPLIPESRKPCETLVRFIDDLDKRLRALRQIELNKLHNAVTATISRWVPGPQWRLTFNDGLPQPRQRSNQAPDPSLSPSSSPDRLAWHPPPPCPIATTGNYYPLACA